MAERHFRRTVRLTASFTRPADTTAYATDDAVADSTTAPTAMTLANAARFAGGGGRIVGVRLAKSTATVTSATFRVWFFRSTPTVYNDNDPFQFDFADREKHIGFTVLPTMVTEGAGSDGAQTPWSASNIAHDFPFDLPSGGRDLYALVQADAAYTPGSAEQFFLEVYVEQD